MFPVNCAKRSCVAISPGASPVSAAGVRNVFRLLAVIFAAASLAACAQSSAVRNSAFVGASRQPSVQHDRTASFFTGRHIASVRKHTPFARTKNAGTTQIASQGVASFYTEGQQTASGEKFDTNA